MLGEQVSERAGLPRTRGDGPPAFTRWLMGFPASPHTRGWTVSRHPGVRPGAGFPAHAGMDPRGIDCTVRNAGLPRTRGDGPGTLGGSHSERMASPAHAGMGPRSVPFRLCFYRASPHTRGWTPPATRTGTRRGGFPAHAGMDPGRRDVPGLPEGLPRTRGDGPDPIRGALGGGWASPHTRGWTLRRTARSLRKPGFPAHAGMDPPARRDLAAPVRLPRTRGDGPRKRRRENDLPRASPHTRGWTWDALWPAILSHGFPAHAGMDPVSSRPTGRPTWLPRTRGDGPLTCIDGTSEARASPHTRGWTPSDAVRSAPTNGFPAHAGMDPAAAG